MSVAVPLNETGNSKLFGLCAIALKVRTPWKIMFGPEIVACFVTMRVGMRRYYEGESSSPRFTSDVAGRAGFFKSW